VIKPGRQGRLSLRILTQIQVFVHNGMVGITRHMPSTFQPFDPRQQFHASHRILPHWHQSGATYFVTFRLADSLPAIVRQRYDELRKLSHGAAFAWVERFLDAGSGDCALGNPEHARAVAAALQHYDEERYSLGAFVVMPNHVHALVQPIGSTSLTPIVHGSKSYTAHIMQRRVGINGRLWQEESFDRIVRDENELRRIHDYIMANPVKASLRQGCFLVGHGSARWLTQSA
jgi:REP element-mobilizing transposase RayT